MGVPRRGSGQEGWRRCPPPTSDGIREPALQTIFEGDVTKFPPHKALKSIT